MPPAEGAIVVVLEPAESSVSLLGRWCLVVQFEFVQDGEYVLSVPVLGIGHPATWFHFVCVDSPILITSEKEAN